MWTHFLAVTFEVTDKVSVKLRLRTSHALEVTYIIAQTPKRLSHGGYLCFDIADIECCIFFRARRGGL
jgi:hypothetical protein